MANTSPMPTEDTGNRFRNFRAQMHEIIFEADTFAGKAFDVVLLVAISLSIVNVMLESVTAYRVVYGPWLRIMEWGFTALFVMEYGLRLYCVDKPSQYAKSFFGLVDLAAILPSFLSLLVPGTQSLLVVRALRLLRVFRVLKLSQYLGEANFLFAALKAGRAKIIVFLTTMLTLIMIVASIMYLVEGEKNGFADIPTAVYWAIVTVTTVGYGDITPQTFLGKSIAAFLMVLGYAIIAVPTGIVSAELTRRWPTKISTQACPACAREGHDPDAVHCKHCGVAL